MPDSLLAYCNSVSVATVKLISRLGIKRGIFPHILLTGTYILLILDILHVLSSVVGEINCLLDLSGCLSYKIPAKTQT